MVAAELFNPPDPPHHPALLSKSAQPGRIRGTALEIYHAVRQNPRFADATLSRSLREAKHLHSRERRFVANSLYALIRYHTLLAHLVHSEDPLDLWDGWLRWQGLPTDKPLRVQQEVETILSSKEPIEALCLIGGFNPHISQALHQSLGENIWDFLWASNQRAPLTLRTNPIKATRDQVRDTLKSQNIKTHALASTTLGLSVIGTANIQGQRSYQNGWFEVQDEGSQHLANLCGAVSGKVIDYCAGAGGKSLAIAAAAPDCEIIACDVRNSALKQLEKRAKRAGLDGLRVHNLATPLTETADTVFVDAPCTGLGTLRRHPELRLRLNQRSLSDTQLLQQEIIQKASERVNPGGRLIYATCSILDEENESVVQSFVEANPDFKVVGAPLKMTPHENNTDGFYGQVLGRSTP